MERGAAKRLIGLDLIKGIACFLVVALHTCYTREPNVNVSSILFYSGVIAIPLFFMTNGYLLFEKTKKDKWYSYKKIGRILLLSFLINSLISLLYILFKHKFINPFSETILNLFFQKSLCYHFWFLGALILIYLLFPCLDYLYLHKRKYFFILSIFLIGTQCLVDGLNIYSSIEYHDLFQRHIPQTFRLESHLSYFILGGVLKSLKPQIKKYATVSNVLLLYLIVIVYQFYMIKNIYPILYCEFFYDNLFVICLTIIIFVYVSDLQIINRIGEGISVLSSLIMIIYIIHPFVIKFYNKFVTININANIIKLIVVFSISAILSWIISKIPYVKAVFKI